eukprot:TRINITY_DN5513_c0_g1_i1.p1 TRINITY_DN5513_c0_g1~~TRINITY_DN5513_c0_g1_i1.p1  ORF type:complete len:245 (+),score=35.87 TRINITY_DN5513_c0_g1_i1:105-839(+)
MHSLAVILLLGFMVLPASSNADCSYVQMPPGCTISSSCTDLTCGFSAELISGELEATLDVCSPTSSLDMIVRLDGQQVLEESIKEGDSIPIPGLSAGIPGLFSAGAELELASFGFEPQTGDETIIIDLKIEACAEVPFSGHHCKSVLDLGNVQLPASRADLCPAPDSAQSKLEQSIANMTITQIEIVGGVLIGIIVLLIIIGIWYCCGCCCCDCCYDFKRRQRRRTTAPFRVLTNQTNEAFSVA